jgi:hypothetical protein
MAGGHHLFLGLALERSRAWQTILVGGNMTGKEGSTLAAPELANQWVASMEGRRHDMSRGSNQRGWWPTGVWDVGRVEWQPKFGQGQRDGVGRASSGAVAVLNYQGLRLAASPRGQKKLGSEPFLERWSTTFSMLLESWRFIETDSHWRCPYLSSLCHLQTNSHDF